MSDTLQQLVVESPSDKLKFIEHKIGLAEQRGESKSNDYAADMPQNASDEARIAAADSAL
ncbi:MAG TPA: hypothetical protein VLA93_18820 [Pyrinomonadaceae bacterium]|nr:hypothetical protein [Pyrinomonadaceae bacterium]